MIKKIYLKLFEISNENKIENFKIDIIGSFNILNRKINFDKVEIENIYSKNSKEDLIILNKLLKYSSKTHSSKFFNSIKLKFF